jgi:hypothetical protein
MGRSWVRIWGWRKRSAGSGGFLLAKYERGCQECQKAKPAQDSKVGVNSSEIVSRPPERVFIDILGPLSQVGGGISLYWWYWTAFLHLFYVSGQKDFLESSKNCLVEKFSPTFGVPQSNLSDNAAVFNSRTFYNVFLVDDSAYHHLSVLPTGFSSRTF